MDDTLGVSVGLPQSKGLEMQLQLCERHVMDTPKKIMNSVDFYNFRAKIPRLTFKALS